jgi:hypothetical protein
MIMRLILGCSLVAFGLVPLAAPRFSAAERFPPPPALSPLATSVIAPPARVRGTDKRWHLVYEISLLNISASARRVDRVEVLTGKGDTVMDFAGSDAVRTIMSDAVDGIAPIDALPSSGGGVLWLDVSFENGARIPARLVHRFTTTALASDATSGAVTTMLGAPTPVRPGSPTVIAPPLRGADFAITNGCCGLSAHTRALLTIDGVRRLAQRFAIDVVRIDDQGRWWTGDPTVNESYLVFGARVVSAASGIVTSTRDDLPENTPPAPLEHLDLGNALGNHVTIDMGDGRFATYAHLQPGSVAVRRGMRVHRGQLLGLVGNTGSSGAPHLHLHVSSTARLATSNGVPFVFTGFHLTGKISNLEAWLGQEASVPAVIAPVAPPARRHGQLPLTADVVTFR